MSTGQLALGFNVMCLVMGSVNLLNVLLIFIVFRRSHETGEAM